MKLDKKIILQIDLHGKMKGRDRAREAVRIRDKRKCQECKRKWENNERRFDVHHLNGMCGKKSRKYDRVEDMTGLITFCHRCHMSMHRTKPLRNNWGKLKEVSIDTLLEFRWQGMSFDEIGNKYGVSSSSVFNKIASRDTA